MNVPPQVAPVITAGFLIALIVGSYKDFLPDAMPNRNSVIRISAMLLGIALAAADYLIHAGARTTGVGLEAAAGAGLANGVASILEYHLASGDLLSFLQSAVGQVTNGSSVVKVGQIVDVPPADPNAPKP